MLFLIMRYATGCANVGYADGEQGNVIGVVSVYIYICIYIQYIYLYHITSPLI